MRYLLPCQCGRKLPVSASQAGDRITCECGATVEAPTLRQLQKLEPLDAAAPEHEEASAGSVTPSSASWSAAHGVTFLGISLVILSAVVIVLLLLNRPLNLLDYVEKADASGLTPAQAWEYWDQLKKGLSDLPPRELVIPAHLFEVKKDQWQWAFGAAIVVGGLGVLISFVGGAMLLSRQSRRPAAPIATYVGPKR